MSTKTTSLPASNTTAQTPSTTGIIALCPGQGAQTVGMGKAWHDGLSVSPASSAARDVFDRADAIVADRLGAPLSSLCFEGPADTLNQTDISQPALYVCAIASWRALQADAAFADVPLVAAMGLSLGEYSALHIAGALDFEAGLELVLLRGRAMQAAAEQQQGGMVALIGVNEEQAHQVCDRARGSDVLVCANFNAPGQIVISGHASACDRAVTVATEMKLRAASLPVAGAFHSPLMQPAADRLAEALAKTAFAAPMCTVLANVDAAAHPGSTAGPLAGRESPDAAQTTRQLLAQQLTSPVRWADSCSRLGNAIDSQPTVGWHELAPGRTLMGLMRRIDRKIKVTAHDGP